VDFKIPNLGGSFPSLDSSIKIHNDLNNPAHGGGHFDLIQGIPGGIDKTRIASDGTVLGGETQIGKVKMDR
jgi:hypothetical protein